MIKNKRQMFIVISVFTLVLLLGTVTYSFFNYTRSGATNAIRTGKIAFKSTQEGRINLTNIFPISSSEINNVQEAGNNVTINIEGETTYTEGIEYLVTAEDVNVTVNDKKIPLNLYITATEDLGNADTNYFENRGGNSSIYKVLTGGVIVPGQYLLVGYIAPGQTGIDGNLNIKAYIDKDKIAISDTYDGTESDNIGTTSNWVNGRTVFTTSEWNSLQEAGHELSFKIRVEANEGVWVDPYTTPNLMNTINYPRNSNIKEIRFIQETPLRMQRRYDAAEGIKVDQTYQDTGKVLAWVEPLQTIPTGTNSLLNTKPSFLMNDLDNKNNVKQIDNETNYVLYIASSGKTQWVTGYSLFGGFTGVEKIVFENVDSSQVTIMNRMFASLSNLANVNVNVLDTSSVVDMSEMFNGCSSLTSVDLSNLGSNSLATIGSIFSGCTHLENINMSGFNFGTITSLATMYGSPFYNLTNIETINLSNANASNVTNMSEMFSGLSNLTNVSFKNANISNVTNMRNLFRNCVNLTTVIFDNTDLSKVETMMYMFKNCEKLVSIDLSNHSLNSLEEMHYMFQNCYLLENVNFSNVTTPKLEDIHYLFDTCSSLESINIDNLGSQYLTNANEIFYNCTSLKTISMKNFNFGTITSLYSLFVNLSNLEKIDMSNSVMSSATAITIGSNLPKLKEAVLDYCGGNNLSEIRNLFFSIPNIEYISMKNFNFGVVNDFDSFFAGKTHLKRVDLSNSRINSSVDYFRRLFEDCTALEIIDLRGIDTSGIHNMYGLFSGCSLLSTIYVSNAWSTNGVTSGNDSNMFSDCTSLVGGNGTIYNSSYTDKTYARIDAPGTPGYLTLAS